MVNNIKLLLMTSKSWGGYNISPPIGLYRLKNHLGEHGIECDILDYDIDEEPLYLQRVAEGHYDVVGMSVSHINMEEDLNTLLKFRDAGRRSGKKVAFIAGGQEATLNHKQWLESGVVEIVFLGFAEEGLKNFCAGLSGGICANPLDIACKIDGVALIDANGKLIYNPSRPLDTEEFRRLSFSNVIKSDINYQKYWDKLRSKIVNGFSHTKFIIETVRLYTTSHCPRKCGFCSSQSFLPSSQKSVAPIMMISAEDVYDLVLYHINKYGARCFLFSDDDFPVGNQEGIQRLFKFCNLVIDAKKSGRLSHEIIFHCQSRVADYLDHEKQVRWDLIDLMKRAGFESTGLGIETFSPRLLRSPFISKAGVTPVDYKRVLDALLEKKIIPIIFIIIGIPDGTADEMVETMNAAIGYILKGADISVNPRMRVNPGSPISLQRGYEVSSKSWQNPENGKTVTIEEYFIPNDPLLANAADKINRATEEELNNIRQRFGLDNSIIPKSLIGLIRFATIARLINRYDAADEYNDIISKYNTPKTGQIND